MTAEDGVAAGSRAVLIGVSAYEYAEFPPVRAARNSLEAMRSLLADPALYGWPAGQITVIANPVSAAGLAADIADLADAATGILLLYYVGHGVLSAGGELCLSVTSTRPDRPKISGLPWDTVADVLRASPASCRLAVLDCCFAGQAVEILAGRGPGLADIAHVEGVYTLTATTGSRAALGPPPGQQDSACTSFTAELTALVRQGIAGRGPRLTLPDLYPVLCQRLRAKGLPMASQRGEQEAGLFAAPNAALAAAAAASGAPARDQDNPSPGPPGAAVDQPDQRRLAGLVTDALHAAHSVADPATKARALAATGVAVAPVDAHRAALLIADAARVAESVSGEGQRALVHAAMAGPLAAADPDRAEQLALAVTGEAARARALAAVAAAVAAFDPARAERLIAGAERAALSGGGSGQAAALAAVAKGLAVIDPDRAERLADQVTDPATRAVALASLSRTVAGADPDRAARLITDATRLALSVTTASAKAPALAAVARTLAATDRSRAARLITDAERTALSIPATNGKAPALASVAEGLAAVDADRAERLARSIIVAGFRAPALAAVARTLATGGGVQPVPLQHVDPVLDLAAVLPDDTDSDGG